MDTNTHSSVTCISPTTIAHCLLNYVWDLTRLTSDNYRILWIPLSVVYFCNLQSLCKTQELVLCSPYTVSWYNSEYFTPVCCSH